MSAGEPSFLLWLREVVQPQADPRSGNAAALDDFSPDGMREYCLYVVGFNRPHKGAVSLHPLRNLVFRASVWLRPENRHRQPYQSQNTARSKKNL